MLTFLKKLFKPTADFTKLVKEGTVIVDVRSKTEFQAGHIDGSQNTPVDQIPKEVQIIKELNKTIITVCRSGNRSGMAQSILSAAGVEV